MAWSMRITLYFTADGKGKNISFDEINIHDHPEKLDEMIKLSGGKRSIPQIFYGDIHIGGSDDLYNMNIKGKLDQLIGLEIK